ncbi:MFS general substrate transporter [Xylona heveae TC161]|uniref:MFS general substrate transporter n=1 Tax=Xylona heveae (strain CBS 132557 / TC161) TaxID=1328760 RepID=A0A165I3U8_XYLHT|nr:MFS general substrate transporter [Xylona heveae TC161]KZF24341.1 MFS general substrate transporter [Xylona heveae TC161]
MADVYQLTDLCQARTKTRHYDPSPSPNISRWVEPNESTSSLQQRSHPSITQYDAQKQHNLLGYAEADQYPPNLSLARDSSKDDRFPEGGVRSWSVVFGSLCALTASMGLLNSIGTFQAYISTHQLNDYSDGTVGWIFSLYICLSFICGIQTGPVFDAKGPRLLIFAGSLLLVLSMFLLGVCTEYWHFIMVFGILGGIATSLVFTPAVSSVGHFFLVRRGLATGIAMTGGSIGGVIFPLLLQSLFPKIGFAWATRVMGFIILVLLVFANIFLRSRLPPKTGSSILPDLRIFRDIAFTFTTAGIFFVEWGLFIPLSYLTSYALSHGVPVNLAYQLIAIFNGSSFFGRWLPGLVSDKFGRFNIMIVTIILCLITTFALWYPAGGSTAMIIAYAVSFGFASGSNIGLTPVCVGQLVETEMYGRYYATCYTIVSLGTLTGIPIAGQILSANRGGYWGLIVFTGSSYAAGLACFGIARIRQTGWRLKAIY